MVSLFPKAFHSPPLPTPKIGVGLRHIHYNQALSDLPINQNIDFVELHAENFFAQGGITIDILRDIGERYEVSVHGTSLGLGSNCELPSDVLDNFSRVVAISQATMVSEHLCFNRAVLDNKLVHSGDLLPLPYNQQSLQVLANHVSDVQNVLQRCILIENLSAYVNVSELDPEQADSFTEVEFLTTLCEMTGCGLLLDLNNLIVNALNRREVDAVASVIEHIEKLPQHLIGEIHLAGFSDKQVMGNIVDDHAQAVSEQCWQVYSHAVSRFGCVPTLIEWDNNLPEWEVLVEQAVKARAICERVVGE